MAQRSGVIQKNIAIMVKNLGIQSRFYISSTIGDRCVSCGQFCIVDTESQSSECFCLGIFVGIGQCCKSEVEKIVITLSFSYIIRQSLYSKYVHGMLDSIADSGCTDILFIPVLNFLTILVFIRFIINRSSKGQLIFIEGRCIGCQDLETGSRLSVRISCTVQGKTGSLFATSTDYSFDLSGILIHHNDRSLWLW